MIIVRWVLILSCCWLLTACGSNVDLDNAGTEALRVSIGDQLHLVEAGKRVALSLKKGAHHIQVKNLGGQVVKDTTINVVKGGLINLAGGEYLVWKDIFSPQSTVAFRKQLLNTQELKIDQTVYDIEYAMLPQNQFFVEQYWDYRLDEPFPKTVHGWELEGDNMYMFKTKLVRLDEFKEVYLQSSSE